ncbi:hypothetical protein amad1_12830 [Alteromonas mediterranea DE1]|uniref:ABC transporter permease n=1 Tax=Alteromonas mediterranea TaxID=314275 RepID=A0AAC8XL57_9ALTE|nr:hypothetical protein amad1_12830 [Alteromonas mediterranea DE1]AGP98077.1 hypothetical protein I635_12810 [Alteromonas mediterranea UM7]AGQ02336.1 hypothetical protein I636_12445 [Alteromonas mediterranea UM4b]AMJ79081.1 ABC transporter permease [Alteromonas mediterranea]AMJ83225.1 ABC transporter permease [Alteromonas mediterranea]
MGVHYVQKNINKQAELVAQEYISKTLSSHLKAALAWVNLGLQRT